MASDNSVAEPLGGLVTRAPGYSLGRAPADTSLHPSGRDHTPGRMRFLSIGARLPIVRCAKATPSLSQWEGLWEDRADLGDIPPSATSSCCVRRLPDVRCIYKRTALTGQKKQVTPPFPRASPGKASA